MSNDALNLAPTFNGWGELDAEQASVSGVDLPSWKLTRDNARRVVTETGMETLFRQPAGGLSMNKSLPCGTALAFQFETYNNNGLLANKGSFAPPGTLRQPSIRRNRRGP